MTSETDINWKIKAAIAESRCLSDRIVRLELVKENFEKMAFLMEELRRWNNYYQRLQKKKGEEERAQP